MKRRICRRVATGCVWVLSGREGGGILMMFSNVLRIAFPPTGIQEISNILNVVWTGL